LHNRVQYIFDQLSAAGPSLTCSWDRTLLGDLQALSGTKWLLAANFRDNAEMMPHLIKQVWLLAALLPPNSLFVSIYESGSPDTWTGQWLGLLSSLLTVVEVDHVITTDGNIKRAEGENRIEFLAKVRNKVLEPLWGGGGGNSSGGVAAAWPADRIIFTNDVYLCVKDFVRLMLHRTDVACGLDYGDRSKDRIPEDKDAEEMQQWGQRTYGSSLPSQRRNLLDNSLHIYDSWVLRDGRGHMFATIPPYTSMHTPYTSARLKAGLPFPVTTCWNGLAILPAKPFATGLRFRSHMPGECRASECSLVCHDLHRLGYGRIVVDPGVQVAYTHYDALGMHLEAVVGKIRRTTWEDVKRAPPIKDGHFLQESEMCCNEDEIDWNRKPPPCHRRSFMRPNYTAIAFPAKHFRAKLNSTEQLMQNKTMNASQI